MKKLILEETSEQHDHSYQLWAELKHHKDYSSLVFSSVWTGAKDPAGEQRKFECFLTKSALANLQELLEATE